MKRIIILLLFLILCISCLSINKTNAVMDRTGIYNCPSMENYSPLTNVGTYCQRDKQVKPHEMKKCEEEYNTIYGPAIKEFRQNKCKIMADIKSKSLTLGTVTCSVLYSIDPPEIKSFTSTNITSQKDNKVMKNEEQIEDIDEKNCLKSLEKSLKQKYPNLTNNVF